MKQVLILTLTMLSLNLSAAIIVKNFGQADQEVGFNDSIFTNNYFSEEDVYAVNFCYLEDPVDICEQVKAAIDSVNEPDLHESADFKSCVLNGDVAIAKYDLVSDWDNLELSVKREIKPCL